MRTMLPSSHVSPLGGLRRVHGHIVAGTQVLALRHSAADLCNNCISSLWTVNGKKTMVLGKTTLLLANLSGIQEPRYPDCPH